MTKSNSGNYFAYMLRLWRDDEHSPWRVMLENPHTGQSLGFSSMTALYAFLDGQTEQTNKSEDSL